MCHACMHACREKLDRKEQALQKLENDLRECKQLKQRLQNDREPLVDEKGKLHREKERALDENRCLRSSVQRLQQSIEYFEHKGKEEQERKILEDQKREEERRI